jgi:hypothetical protein
MLEVSNAVARAGGLFTVVHDAQNSATWFDTWKAKCEAAAGVIVIFSEHYRNDFTRALQQEAGAILGLYRRKQIKLLILDPAVHNAANVRVNIDDGAAGMGDIDAWVAFVVANGVGNDGQLATLNMAGMSSGGGGGGSGGSGGSGGGPGRTAVDALLFEGDVRKKPHVRATFGAMPWDDRRIAALPRLAPVRLGGRRPIRREDPREDWRGKVSAPDQQPRQLRDRQD